MTNIPCTVDERRRHDISNITMYCLAVDNLDDPSNKALIFPINFRMLCYVNGRR